MLIYYFMDWGTQAQYSKTGQLLKNYILEDDYKIQIFIEISECVKIFHLALYSF